ncbi:TauD/TfdA family dioxygenase [Streptomyces sp. HSG2]|uniref:TauD/TfdA family dioxygenase n=1 Tax=Streptomyces sp. HSG2 TaxID=2797167 RepID=UPI001F5B8572|nr:TauD/TfdA family dioxygenase [Streptomyces sp. HSG2]
MTLDQNVSWVTEPGAPVTAVFDGVSDGAAAAGLLAARRGDLRSVLDRHGALFLRGLPVHTAEDFALVRDALFAERAKYQEKATPRSDFGDDVFSSTDLPPAQSIRMHNENSYTLTFPGTLLFGCLTAPEEGGAVADVRKVLS